MREHIRLDGLLFSSDAQVLGVMNRVLESFSIETEVCSQVGSALDAVEAAIVDGRMTDYVEAGCPPFLEYTITEFHEL